MLAALANLTGSSLFELILLRKEALKEFVQNGMSDFKRMSLDQQIAFEVCNIVFPVFAFHGCLFLQKEGTFDLLNN